MHDARRQLADRGELVALRDLGLHALPLGHVLADRDHVGDLVALEPHRNLAEPVVSRFAAGDDFDFPLLDLPGREDAVEIGTKLRRGLPRQHLEHRTPHDVVAPKPLCPCLALAIPGLNAIVAVHDVESERQAVDDETR